MAQPIANSGDPDQMLSSAVSDLGLHCLQITLLGVSRLQNKNVYLIDTSLRDITEEKAPYATGNY